MTDFPKSALETRELAIKLVTHLKGGIKNTQGSRAIWTGRNFALLGAFCCNNDIDPIYSGPNTGPECLWDFMGYMKGKGALICAESEWDTNHAEIAKDFDKLLYGSSPIKIMICRIDTRYPTLPEASKEAEAIRALLEGDLKGSCTNYPPGSVFIIYCVWWAEEGGPNRDFPYILQIGGAPNYVSVGYEQHFEAAPAEPTHSIPQAPQ